MVGLKFVQKNCKTTFMRWGLWDSMRFEKLAELFDHYERKYGETWMR